MGFAPAESKKSMTSSTYAKLITEIHVDMQGRKRKVDSHWKRLLNAGYAISDGISKTPSRVKYTAAVFARSLGISPISIMGFAPDKG